MFCNVSYMEKIKSKKEWHMATKPLSIPLGMFWIFMKIRGDIREWMFITVVNNTGDKLFSGVNNTGEKLILVTDFQGLLMLLIQR